VTSVRRALGRNVVDAELGEGAEARSAFCGCDKGRGHGGDGGTDPGGARMGAGG
jgi:hypothetical protein